VIEFIRWQPPPMLAPMYEAELRRIRRIAAERPPTRSEIGDRHQLLRRFVSRMQALKCCYCESKLSALQQSIDHFRPRAEVMRRTRHRAPGYWWLTLDWDNLLCVCRRCNSLKGSWFRLRGDGPIDNDPAWTPDDSLLLQPEQRPPGREHPLLIDPSADFGDDGPIAHIRFRPLTRTAGVRWVPTARAGSERGYETIARLGLDRYDLLDLYDDHSAQVQREVDQFHAVLAGAAGEAGPDAVSAAWRRLERAFLAPERSFVGLSYDIIDHHIPRELRAARGLVLAIPRLVVSEEAGLRAIITNTCDHRGIATTQAQLDALENLSGDDLYEVLALLEEHERWPPDL
jgi:uncharacterized protein (TIGR02646 family)